MGYLSCKAESAISVSNSQTPTSSSSHKTQQNEKHKPPVKIQQFEYSDLDAATNGFSDQRLLGRGSHGSVYKAVLRGGRPVAVKRPSTATSDAVDNEIDILSSVRSPGLVNLLGFTGPGGSPDRRRRLLVVEFMSNGTLYDAIHHPSAAAAGGPRNPPNWGRRIKLIFQISKAIETLHSLHPPVIHRDIKSANVLIDKNFNARLGDFGLALRCHVDDFRLRSTPPAGTIGYLDPLYVTPDNLGPKTDVFSFGILLLEIISGRKAIDIAYSPPSIVDWAIPLIRRGKFFAIYDPRIEPLRDCLVVKQLAVIAAKCVRSCRERRPSMKEVSESLGGLCKLVPVHSWNGFPNPCMMVETVGRPVGPGRARADSRSEGGVGDVNLDDLDGKFGKPLRSSRRVYSDLGFRNNLMDLMAGNDENSEFSAGEEDRVESRSKSKSANKSSNFAMGSGRFAARSSRFLSDGGDEKGGLFRFKRNQSVGEGSELYSRRNDMIT